MPSKTVAEGIKQALSLIQQRKAIDAQLAELGVDESVIATMYGVINEVDQVRKGFKSLRVKMGKAYAPRKDSHAEKALEHLKGGEKSYQDIAKHLKIEQLTPVMKPLLKHKLVSERKEGRNKFYKLA